MRAWRVHEFGEPRDVLVQEDVPEPTAADVDGMGMSMGGWVPAAEGEFPYDDWVVMDMTVAALALPDVTMARGTYPVPVPRPYTSGQEGVGIVTDAGSTYRHLLGARVVACCIQPFGSLAPVAIGVGTVFEVPEGMTDEEGAALRHPRPHRLPRGPPRGAQVQAGETVAVLGAAGGLGSAYVQLCVAAGARVIAIVGGPEKVAFCEELGAEMASTTARGDVVDAVRAATGGRGVDVIIDPVQGRGGRAPPGRWCPTAATCCAATPAGSSPHDPHFYVANHTLVGATLGGYPTERMQPRSTPRARPASWTWSTAACTARSHPQRRLRRGPRRRHRPGRAADHGPGRGPRRRRLTPIPAKLCAFPVLWRGKSAPFREREGRAPFRERVGGHGRARVRWSAGW